MEFRTLLKLALAVLFAFGLPGTVLAQPATGGIINIGQVLGPIIQPFVDSLVQALIVVMVTWVLWVLKTKLNINIDDQHRNAIIQATQRQASSLVADGFVKVEQDGKLKVDQPELYRAVNTLMINMPDAVKHFDINPGEVASRIVDMIPQVPSVAGAQANMILRSTLTASGQLFAPPAPPPVPPPPPACQPTCS